MKVNLICRETGEVIGSQYVALNDSMHEVASFYDDFGVDVEIVRVMR